MHLRAKAVKLWDADEDAVGAKRRAMNQRCRELLLEKRQRQPVGLELVDFIRESDSDFWNGSVWRSM